MLLTIAGVVCVIAILAAVFPAIGRGSSAMVSAAGNVGDRIKSQIRIVHATGQPGGTEILLWVKNVGSSNLVAIEETDVFCGTEGNFTRIPYIDDAGGGFPRWTYGIENDSEWKPTATVKITITYSSGLSSATYFVKVITANGVSDEHFFSI